MRQALSFLFIVLLAARSVLPTGFMLGASSEGGSLSIVICTAQGAKAITLSPDGQPSKHEPGKGSNNDVCPYAASAPVALGAALPPEVATPVTYVAADHRSADVLVRVVIAARAQFARGPPSFFQS
jgi:hypothetical protein